MAMSKPTPSASTPAGPPTEAPTRILAPVPTYTPSPTKGPSERLSELGGSIGPIYSLAWSPDGRTLASASYGQVKLWDVKTNGELHTLDGHTSYVWGVACGCGTWTPARNWPR